MYFIPCQYYYPCSVFTPCNQVVQPTQTQTPMKPQSENADPSQRSRFSKEEDKLLKQLVNSQQQPKWNEIARQMRNRTPRQCRERYNNYLQPNLLNGPWSHEEETLLLQLYEKYGPKWSLISQSFSSRSPVNVKNHHSSLVNQSILKNKRKKANAMSIERKTTKSNKEENVTTDTQNQSNSKTVHETPEAKKESLDDEDTSEKQLSDSRNEQNEEGMFSNFDLWSNNHSAAIDNDLLVF